MHKEEFELVRTTMPKKAADEKVADALISSVKLQLENSERKNEILQSALSELQARNEQLEKFTNHHAEEVADMVMANDKLRVENDVLLKEKAQMVEALEKVKQQNAEMMVREDAATIKELQGSCRAALACITEMEGQLGIARKRVSELENQIASMNAAAEDVKERIALTDVTHATVIEDREKRISALEAQLRDAEQYAVAKQKAYDTWQATSQQAQKVVDQRIEELEKQLDQFQRLAGALHGA